MDNYIYFILLFLVLLIIYYFIKDNKNIKDNKENKENFRNNKNDRIIHISGISGSGKNYLLEKIKIYFRGNNKILYIDSDEIWNKESEKILNNFKILDNEIEIGKKLDYLSNKKTTEEIDKILENNKNNYKMIIIVGHTYKIFKNNKYNFEKYYINENKNIVYKRLMKRNFENFLINKDYVMQILNDDNINNIMKPFYIRLKIRNMAPFPCNFLEFQDIYEDFLEMYKQQNYNILSQDEIFNLIINN